MTIQLRVKSSDVQMGASPPRIRKTPTTEREQRRQTLL